VWGLLGAFPFGGMTWQVIHHLVGLRRLGFDVWYVEDSDRWVYGTTHFGKTADVEGNVRYVDRWMKRIGLGDRWVFRVPDGDGACLGALDFDGLLALYRASDAVLNLCGAQESLPYHADARCRIYIQTDPVSDQVAVANGDQAKAEELRSYTHLFTYGANLGASDCLVPDDSFTWIPTVPPVSVDMWATDAPPSSPGRLTTVAHWRHKAKDVTWADQDWRWSKHAEFQRFIRIAARSSLPLEMAVSSISNEERDELRANGWRTRSTTPLNRPSTYRSYIQESLGEFTVAKEQYVAPRSGWFSDRSVCYLAAGRPVIMQETGFSKTLPTGTGLIGFSDAEEALAAIDSVNKDYDRHADGARHLAREVFDAEHVLGDMMRTVGLL
jgi:hypothetical protein